MIAPVRTVVLVSLAVLSGTLTASAGADLEGWPHVWDVNGNGESGKLELSLHDDGTLRGRLLDERAEGFLAGRHLLLRRFTKGGVEVWEGWLAGGTWLLAGTFSISRGGATHVYPWYATAENAGPTHAPSPSPEPDGAATRPADPVPPAPAGAGRLAGTWTSLTGERFEIRHDGQELTVTLADGTSRAGRMTGSSTLVVGLREGCCNGKLEDTDTIVWSDGARWLRGD
jgi:hypothetical protein